MKKKKKKISKMEKISLMLKDILEEENLTEIKIHAKQNDKIWAIEIKRR